MSIVKLDTLDDSRLDAYARLTEVQLLNREYPDLKKKVFTAIQNSKIPGWEFHKKENKG